MRGESIQIQQVLLGTLANTFLPKLQERAKNPTRPCSASDMGPCTEKDHVRVCLHLCAVSSETSNRKEKPCQDGLSWNRRNRCITHPEGCAQRSKRTLCSPDNENNEVRLSKETVSLPYPQTSAPEREEELSERSFWATRVKDRAEKPLKTIEANRAHKEGESSKSSREINNNMKNFHTAEEM